MNCLWVVKCGTMAIKFAYVIGCVVFAFIVFLIFLIELNVGFNLVFFGWLSLNWMFLFNLFFLLMMENVFKFVNVNWKYDLKFILIFFLMIGVINCVNLICVLDLFVFVVFWYFFFWVNGLILRFGSKIFCFGGGGFSTSKFDR